MQHWKLTTSHVSRLLLSQQYPKWWEMLLVCGRWVRTAKAAFEPELEGAVHSQGLLTTALKRPFSEKVLKRYLLPLAPSKPSCHAQLYTTIKTSLALCQLHRLLSITSLPNTVLSIWGTSLPMGQNQNQHLLWRIDISLFLKETFHWST